MNRIEEIKDIKILAGQTMGTVQFSPANGEIESVLIFPKDATIDCPGLVRTRLATSGGTELVKMQPIQNLRSRNIDYEKDGHPISVQGGMPLTWTVYATAAFASDFLADIVLRYKDTNDQCVYNG